MDGTCGCEVVVINTIYPLKQLTLDIGREWRPLVHAWIVLINPIIQGAAGLLELRPLLRISHQDVAQHGIAQGLQFTSNFARELESLDLGSCELGFNLLDT